MTTPIRVLHLRGVKEPVDSTGVSGTFLGALDRQRFFPVLPTSIELDYGFPRPFADAAADARRRVIAAVLAAPNPVILTGYSGGAFVIGDLAADIAADRVPGIRADRIRAVALLADPKRPAGAGTPGIYTPGGYGIAGQRDIPEIETFWGTASQDAISSLDGDNPLRTVADLSKAFTTHPRGWDRWSHDMFHTLTQREIQPWWMFWNRPGRWGAALNALAGYLFTGAHTTAYLTEGVCVKLAAAINEAVTE